MQSIMTCDFIDTSGASELPTLFVMSTVQSSPFYWPVKSIHDIKAMTCKTPVRGYYSPPSNNPRGFGLHSTSRRRQPTVYHTTEANASAIDLNIKFTFHAHGHPVPLHITVCILTLKPITLFPFFTEFSLLARLSQCHSWPITIART